MTIRPVDDTDDILPVLSSSALLSDAPAVTTLVRDQLNLLSGEWSEHPAWEWGCETIDMLRSSQVTVQDAPVLIATAGNAQSVRQVASQKVGEVAINYATLSNMTANASTSLADMTETEYGI